MYKILLFSLFSLLGALNLSQAASLNFSMNAVSALAKLESSSGGRLGVMAINTSNNQSIEYRSQERFPLGCTSKVLAVASLLHESVANPKILEEKIYYTPEDIKKSEWAPITEKHLKHGLSVKELSAAAIEYSDNAAMNALVYKIGGLKIINQFIINTLGDHLTHLDNLWPKEAYISLNNLQDSSTPKAIAADYQKLVLGNVLAPYQKFLLQTWLKNSVTGKLRIRAGTPKTWLVGDKTGTAQYGTTNDVAIIWPPHCQPIILAVYFTQNTKNAIKREDIIANATKIILTHFIQQDSCLQKN